MMARGAVRKAVRCGGFSEVLLQRVGQKSKKLPRMKRRFKKGRQQK
jgi:hypothetical protein